MDHLTSLTQFVDVSSALSTVVAGIISALTASIAIFQVVRSVRRQRTSEDAIEAAEAAGLVRETAAVTDQEPVIGTISAWDLTRLTLERFTALNRGQKQLTFWVSVLASSAGFVVMLAGVWIALRSPGQSIPTVSVLAAVSGGLTQVIGATFLFLYRSTVREGLVYYASLDRLNTVALAWYIITAMRDETRGQQVAQDAAKATLAISLAASGPGVLDAALGLMSERIDSALRHDSPSSSADGAAEKSKNLSSAL
jgi:hypothetical protein